MIAQHGDVARWGDLEHLVANVIDVLQAGNWQFAQKAAGKKKRIKHPKPMWRPGVAAKADPERIGTRKYTPAQMRRILDSWSDGATGPTEVEEVR